MLGPVGRSSEGAVAVALGRPLLPLLLNHFPAPSRHLLLIFLFASQAMKIPNSDRDSHAEEFRG